MNRVPLFVCRGLRKAFGERVAVEEITFQIEPGQAYGLLGPNGAGKTTTIRMIVGLLQSDAGEVLIQGRNVVTDPLVTKAAIGFVPHEIALYTDLSAIDNLKFWGRIQGLSGRDLSLRCDEALDLVGLQDRAHDRVAEFSGGMQRRLNLAVALVHRPRLLVLDEPTVGVDPQSRTAILDRLAELRAAGVAVLYTTHYMEEVERFCDVIGIIDHGKMIAEGSRRDLLALLGASHRINVIASGNLGELANRVFDIRGVNEARVVVDGLHVGTTEPAAVLPAVLETANECDVRVSSIEIFEPNLEQVFLHLTGRTLRD
jgi:ABC-2 type transport system ATP-binding protein